MYFTEYERLKRAKQEAVEKSKKEQLDKLQKDLGYGKSVAMETNTVDQQPLPRQNPEIFLGASGEGQSDIDDDEKSEDPQEQLSFQRFLAREREKNSRSTS